MRIKEYTLEEIHAATDRIVGISFNKYRGTVRIFKPEDIIKFTPKQMKTRGRTVNLADFGLIKSYGAAYFLEEDAEAAIEEYRTRSIERMERELESTRERTEKEVALLKGLKLVEGGSEYD